MLLIKYGKYDVSYYMPTKTLYIHKAMLVKDYLPNEIRYQNP